MDRSGPVIRHYDAEDRRALLDLASRLTIGIAPWRSAAGMQAAARTWVETSIAKIGPEGTVFVAELEGAVGGFASVAREVAFTGEAQAYIGELAVAAGAERLGIGQALLAAVKGLGAGAGTARDGAGYRSGERTRKTLLRAVGVPG